MFSQWEVFRDIRSQARSTLDVLKRTLKSLTICVVLRTENECQFFEPTNSCNPIERGCTNHWSSDWYNLFLSDQCSRCVTTSSLEDIKRSSFRNDVFCSEEAKYKMDKVQKLSNAVYSLTLYAPCIIL